MVRVEVKGRQSLYPSSGERGTKKNRWLLVASVCEKRNTRFHWMDLVRING
jgi:hypothetical protein